MKLEVSADQRSTLDGMLLSLPRGPVDTKLPPASKLASLFYHPNAGARVLALVVSAGFDLASGRDEHAGKKLDRAVQVFTLVSDDSAGRDHLEGLKNKLTGDLSGFLTTIHEEVAPYLRNRMDTANPPPPRPVAMPRVIEDGAELPTERRSVPDRPPARPARRREPEPEPAPVEAAEQASEAADTTEAVEAEAPVEASVEAPVEAPVEAASADDAEADAGDSTGPSEQEAAAAAAAALAAIEAPYEDVVEDDAPPRFDPDRDLKPDDSRRRRRRSRTPEGLERPRPDQVARKEEAAAAAAPAASEAPDEVQESDLPEPVRVERSGDGAAVAEAGLEALKLALRRAREGGFEGRLAVEVTISIVADSDGDDEDREDGRRRRRRRRRRSRSD